MCPNVNAANNKHFLDSTLPNDANVNSVELITRQNNDVIIDTYSPKISDNNLEYTSSSSSNEENINISESEEDIELIIAKWACRNSICHSVLDDLLNSLSKCSKFKNLHKDSRILLHTPPTTVLKTIKGGVYYHFEIIIEIEYLQKIHQNLPSTLFLMVGVDGLPVTKNPPSQLWPILGYFTNIPDKTTKVFLIGAYYGKSKPDDFNEYLKDFVDELCDLINNGIIINSLKFKVILKAIICDSPAKASILNIRGHTAKNSCLRCHAVGEFDNNRVYFPHFISSIRTHEEFVQCIDLEFHYGETVLSRIPMFNIINNIPCDFMHSILIGVTKKILTFWTGGVKHHHLALPKQLIVVLDNKLNSLGQYIPHEFQRAPNENTRNTPIHDAPRLKATEFRQILLYTGMIIFQDVVSGEVYNHFLELCVAIRILSVDNISEEYIEYAKSLINHFVASFTHIYGKSFMSHNMHTILHLADDVKKFGSLNNFSAFKFESFMQPLKKKIKSGVKPLQQLVRRYAEDKVLWQKENLEPNIFIGPFKYQCKNKNRPFTEYDCEPQHTGWKMNNFILKLNMADNCVKMVNNDIVPIENIATSKSDNEVVIIGRKFLSLTKYFDKPCSSQLLGIHKATTLSHLKSWKLNKIKEKMMRLPMANGKFSVILPLLHLQ